MNKRSAIACVVLLFAVAPAAQAQSTRTWVASYGDDASLNCTRTAPCKTFAGAINKTADDGYISVIDASGYGAVNITKSVTIEGQGARGSALQSSSGTTAIIINGRGIAVTLRNISIEGYNDAAYGIRVLSAGRVLIEDCNITNFGVGIYVPGFTNTIITDTRVKRSVNEGIHIANGSAVLTRVLVTGNGGVGLLAGGPALVTVKDSVSSYNETGYGAAFNAAAQMDIENSVASNNDFGLLSLSGATVRLSNSTIVHSSSNAMFNDGASNLLTFSNNRFADNANPGVFTGSIMVR